MREITRIHIAKIAYDVELDAKKEIEEYIDALERYANDPDILDDIEIRITELLAEHGVAAGGVITRNDLAAVRAQLGEPSDFAPEEDKEGVVDVELEGESRRVYRDESDAIIGGVLAGLGKFFGIDPLWVRLIFIVLLLVSFGTAFLVYLILWLIIPPAKTAAEKLRMNGQPITLDSIKALSERVEPMTNGTAVIVRQILRVSTGIFLIATAIGAIAAVAMVAIRFFFEATKSPEISSISSTEMGLMITTFSFFAVAGLLLSALAIVLANATLRRVWNRRISIAVVVIIVAGLLAFVGGVGTIVSGNYAMNIQADENRSTVSADLPNNFAGVKDVKVLADDSGIGIGNTDITIIYTVSDKARYELHAPNGVKPEFVVASDGLSATIKVTKIDSEIWKGRYLGSSELHVYGPALDRLTTEVNSPSFHYYADRSQENLEVVARGSNLNLTGKYSSLSLVIEEGARVTVDEATVSELIVDNTQGELLAGVVSSLTVKIPDACPAIAAPGESNALIHVRAVSSGKLFYNGKEQPAETVGDECGKVIVGDNKESMGLE